jgi:hypothetical protein
MLPTISATVIGAYIVSTWINPKTPPEPAKVAARAQEPAKTEPAKTEPAKAEPAKAEPAKAEPAAAQEAQPAQEASLEPAAETKPAEAKPVESPKPVKAASVPERVRVIPIVKQQANETSTASIQAPEAASADERKDVNRDAGKDANELARAAILRLRGNETARAADEAAKPAVSAIRVQQARAVPDVAPPTVAPPLPPAVSIASPRVASGEGADQPAAYPDRMSPPAEIPAARNPLNLQASARIEIVLPCDHAAVGLAPTAVDLSGGPASLAT